MTSILYDALGLTDFGINKVGIIGFEYRLEARR